MTEPAPPASPGSTRGLPFFDHETEAYARHPYACLAAARASSAVVRTPTGYGVLTHAGCLSVFLDADFRPGVFELVRRAAGERVATTDGRTLLGSEGADHRELRRALSPWFTPGRIETLRAHTAGLVSACFEALGPAGEIDVMDALASRLPPAVFCWMVGCDPAAGPDLAAWSRIALQAFSGDPTVMDDVVAAIRRLREFADALVEEKQRTAGDDLASALVAAVEAGVLTARDVRALLTELLSASVDNTIHSIGIALWLLARHPEVWDGIAAGTVAVERAVEECARFEPVVRHTTVVAVRDAEVGGAAIPAGSLVTLYVAAAHRDPAAFPDPDRFDVGRESSAMQLEFGFGRHFCLGAALARMEIQEVVRAACTRWEPPTVLPGVRERLAVAGEIERLPVAFRTRRA